MSEQENSSLLIPVLMLLAFPCSFLLSSYGNPVFVVVGAGISLVGLLRIGRHFGKKMKL